MFKDIGEQIEKDFIKEGKIIGVFMVILLVVFIYSLGYMAS